MSDPPAPPAFTLRAPPVAPDRRTPSTESGAAPDQAPDTADTADTRRPAGAAVLGGLDVPRDTTPTFELEMLVSGAVLFGLFQVPPAVRAVWAERLPHLTQVGASVTGPLVMMVLVVFYALIGCFVLHLALRAYWVALVGAHSVFPHGVRWDQHSEYGPIQSRFNEARVRPLPEFIARVDNAASLVFASGFVLGASVIAASAMIGVMGVFTWAVTAALGPRRGLLVAAAVYFPVMLALAAAPMIDMKYGTRVAPHSRFGRALAFTIRMAQGLLPTSVRSLSSVLTSNVPKRVAWSATVVGFTGAMALAASDIMPGDPELPGAGNYWFFNGAAPGAALPPARYGSLRGPWEASLRGPSIDGEVVTGPYLRLYVPYRAAVHNEALSAACPGLTRVDDVPNDPAPAQQAAVDAVLRCAARVHAVRVDGRPVDALRYHFSADPRTNRRGFVAFVPVSGLAAGEHRLEVMPVRRAGYTGVLTPYVIPFWR